MEEEEYIQSAHTAVPLIKEEQFDNEELLTFRNDLQDNSQLLPFEEVLVDLSDIKREADQDATLGQEFDPLFLPKQEVKLEVPELVSPVQSLLASVEEALVNGEAQEVSSPDVKSGYYAISPPFEGFDEESVSVAASVYNSVCSSRYVSPDTVLSINDIETSSEDDSSISGLLDQSQDIGPYCASTVFSQSSSANVLEKLKDAHNTTATKTNCHNDRSVTTSVSNAPVSSGSAQRSPVGYNDALVTVEVPPACQISICHSEDSLEQSTSFASACDSSHRSPGAEHVMESSSGIAETYQFKQRLNRYNICNRKVLKEDSMDVVGEDEYSDGAESPSPSGTAYDCFKCDKRFTQRRDIISHLVTHTIEKLHTCSTCNKHFSQKQALKRHILTHTVDQPHACTVCRQQFTGKGNLKLHMRSHTCEKPDTSSTFNNRFTRKQSLKQRIRTPKVKKLYACSTCKKRFKERKTLKQHILTHTGEKPYACSVCSQQFTQQSNLQRHMRSHTAEKPYVCPACNSRFSRKHDLKRHILTNTVDQPHLCSIAGKCFGSVCYLQKHLHTCAQKKLSKRKKTFTCSMCNKQYTLKHSLKQHILAHMVDKPHVCSICGMGYSLVRYLQKHLHTHAQ